MVSLPPESCYLQRENPWYPLNKRMCRTQNQSALSGEEKNLLCLLVIKSWIIHPIAKRLGLYRLCCFDCFTFTLKVSRWSDKGPKLPSFARRMKYIHICVRVYAHTRACMQACIRVCECAEAFTCVSVCGGSGVFYLRSAWFDSWPVELLAKSCPWLFREPTDT